MKERGCARGVGYAKEDKEGWWGQVDTKPD